MKRLLVVLTFVFVVTLTACGGSDSKGLEGALEKLEKADSYTMKMSMDGVPFFGEITITSKVDGDLRYEEYPFGDPVYSKIVDDEEFQYYLDNNGEYVLSEYPIYYEDEEEDYEFLDEIDAEDFEQDESNDLVWIYTEENLYQTEDETEYMTEIVITLDEDGDFYSMTFIVESEELTSNVEVLISDINNTTISLP